MIGYLLSFAFLIALFGVIAVPLWLWEKAAKRKKLAAAFANRQALASWGFYERYFQARGVPFFVVSKVRELLEEVLGADLSCLSAEDDFNQNLSFFWDYDSGAGVEIVLWLEQECEIEITDREAEKAHTVADIVDLVWLKVRQRPAAAPTPPSL